MCKITYVTQLNDKNMTLLTYYLLNTSMGIFRRQKKKKKIADVSKKTHHFDWLPFEIKVPIIVTIHSLVFVIED